MGNSTQRAAYAVLTGDTPQEVNTLIDTLFDTIKIFDEQGTNILYDTRVETYLTTRVE